MLRSYFALFFICILSSCSVFKTAPSLKNQPLEKLLKAVKVTGEGKGRLGFKQQSFVFSYDALLRDLKDWILAVEIPLHGEEVMILEDIRQSGIKKTDVEAFEARINRQIDPYLKGKVLPEMRSLIRFVLSSELGLSRRCRPLKDHQFECQVEHEQFHLSITDKEVRIKKVAPTSVFLELVAQNLTEPFFSKTNFTFHSNKLPTSTSPSMTLELFWKK